MPRVEVIRKLGLCLEHQLMEECMLIAIARFREVPADRRAGFEAWFDWSNNELREAEGLLGRRLLRASDGTYTEVAEHQSEQTFAAMNATGVAAHVQSRLRRILKEVPQIATHEVVHDLATSASCCGGTGSDQRRAALEGTALKAANATAAPGGCCRG